VRGAARVGEPNLHEVNAWLANDELVLGEFATDAESNEITALAEPLTLLDVRGAVVSIEAMGCQKSIAKCVREQGAGWLFGLKAVAGEGMDGGLCTHRDHVVPRRRGTFCGIASEMRCASRPASFLRRGLLHAASAWCRLPRCVRTS